MFQHIRGIVTLVDTIDEDKCFLMQCLLNDELDELVCVQFAERYRICFELPIIPGFYFLIGWI